MGIKNNNTNKKTVKETMEFEKHNTLKEKRTKKFKEKKKEDVVEVASLSSGKKSKLTKENSSKRMKNINIKNVSADFFDDEDLYDIDFEY